MRIIFSPLHDRTRSQCGAQWCTVQSSACRTNSQHKFSFQTATRRVLFFYAQFLVLLLSLRQKHATNTQLTPKVLSFTFLHPENLLFFRKINQIPTCVDSFVASV